MAEFGSGCSISIKHALERAVTELVKCISNVGDDVLEEDTSAHELFDILPGLAPLQRFEIDYSILNNARFDEQTELKNLLLNEEDGIRYGSSKHLLDSCISNLTESGFDVLYRIDTFGEIGKIARVFVPKFDRFHHIRSGYQVAPNQALL